MPPVGSPEMSWRDSSPPTELNSQAIEGKPPEITRDHACTLLASLDTSRPVGHRDKALIATLIYTTARAGAVASLRLKDFTQDGTQYLLRLMEKGRKSRSIPVRHDLQQLLLTYLGAIRSQSKPKDTPFIRSVAGQADQLTSQLLRNINVCRMIKRRLRRLCTQKASCTSNRPAAQIIPARLNWQKAMGLIPRPA